MMTSQHYWSRGAPRLLGSAQVIRVIGSRVAESEVKCLAPTPLLWIHCLSYVFYYFTIRCEYSISLITVVFMPEDQIKTKNYQSFGIKTDCHVHQLLFSSWSFLEVIEGTRPLLILFHASIVSDSSMFAICSFQLGRIPIQKGAARWRCLQSHRPLLPHQTQAAHWNGAGCLHLNCLVTNANTVNLRYSGRYLWKTQSLGARCYNSYQRTI